MRRWNCSRPGHRSSAPGERANAQLKAGDAVLDAAREPHYVGHGVVVFGDPERHVVGPVTATVRSPSPPEAKTS
jgi:hypothetical protein